MAINESATVQVDVNGKQAQDAIQNLRKEAGELRKSIRDAYAAGDMTNAKKFEKQLKENAKSAQLMKQQLYDVDKVLRNLGGATPNELKKAFRDINRQLNSGEVKRGTVEWKRLTNQMKQVKGEMARVRQETTLTSSGFGKMTAGVKTFLGAVGITGGLYYFVSLLKSVFRLSIELDKSLSSLSAITGLRGKDLEYFKNEALAMSRETRKGAVDIVKAFELVGSIRPELLKDKEALAEVTKQAIILSEATGGKLGLEEAAKATAGTLNQFSKASSEAGSTINVLAAGSKYGSAQVVEITKAIDKFGAVADAGNVSLEQSVGLIETLAEKQIIGAEAGTNLRNVLIKLQEDNGNYTDGVFNLDLALSRLGESNMSVTELTKIFGKENVVAAQILVNNRQKVTDYTAAVTGTNTALEQQAIQNINVVGMLDKLGNSWDTFMLKLQNSNGRLYDNLRFINAIMDAINRSDSETSGPTGLFDSSGVIKETELAKMSMEELDKELQTLNNDADIYYNNWKTKTGDEQVFWAAQYSIAKQNIELIEKLKLVNNGGNTSGSGEAGTGRKSMSVDDFIKENAEEFKAWKEANKIYQDQRSVEELNTRFSEERWKELEKKIKNREMDAAKAKKEAMKNAEAAMKVEYNLPDDQNVEDSPELQQAMEVAKRELEVWKGYYFEQLQAYKDMLANKEITRKEYNDKVKALEVLKDIDSSPELQQAALLAQYELEIWQQSYEGQRAAYKDMLDKNEISTQEYHDRIAQLDTSEWQGKMAKASEYFGYAISMYSQLLAANTSRMNAELAEAEGNEAKQEAIKKQYGAKRKRLEKQNAILSAAQAILNIWATSTIPYPAAIPANLAMSFIVGGATAAQISEIDATKFGTGRYPVRAQDGSTYNARYYGKPTTTEVVNGPALISELQNEMIVDGPTTSQLLLKYPHIVNGIKTLSAGGTPQFADGKYPETATNTTAAPGVDPAMMAAMNNFAAAVQMMVANGLKAYVVTDENYFITHNKGAEKYDAFQSKVN